MSNKIVLRPCILSENGKCSRGYDSISELSAGFFLVEQSGKFGIMSSDAMEILPCIYDDVFLQHTYKGDVFVHSKSERYGVSDASGNIVLANMFSNLICFNDLGLAAVQMEDRWAIVTVEGSIVHPYIFDTIDWEHETDDGLWPVTSEGKSGAFVPATRQLIWTPPAED